MSRAKAQMPKEITMLGWKKDYILEKKWRIREEKKCCNRKRSGKDQEKSWPLKRFLEESTGRKENKNQGE